MSWFRVDDRLHSHPKFVDLVDGRGGMSAAGLWLLAGSWASGQDTDGEVPLAMVKRLGGRKAQAEALVDAGLWEPTEDGYRFHDWDDYRPPQRSEEDKAKVRERVRRHRAKKRRRNGALRNGETSDVLDRTIPDPSRTDPDHATGESRSNSPPKARPPDPRALAQALTEALHARSDAPTPPWRDTGQTQRRSQLRPAWEAGGALMAELVASTGSTDAAVSEVLANLEAWARLADQGLVDAASWKEGHLLTPNGYRRMVREVENGGDPKRKPDATTGSVRPGKATDYGPVGEMEIT